MKHTILLPLFLLSGVFFYACSKEDDKINTPGDKILETYYPGTTMEIKELAIYTNNGIVTDADVIQSFIDRNVSADSRSNFYVGASSIPVPASAQTLHFLNNNRVNMNGVNMEITGYKDSVMVVSEYTSTPFPTFTTTCGLLLSKVPDYSPFISCPAANCESYRKSFSLIKSGANYYAPLLTYAVVTNECAITPTEIPAISTVNDDLRSLLSAGDSVLIQFAKLPLVKKTATN